MKRLRLISELMDEPDEVHALVIGFRAGFSCRTWWVRAKSRPANADVRDEPHYYDGGHILGSLAQLLLLCLVGVWMLGHL